MKIKLPLTVAAGALLTGLAFESAPAQASGQFVNYVGNCSGARAARVRSSPKMQRALQELSRMAGRPVTAYSCIRTPQRQGQLYRQMGGNPNRVGSPRGSQHVVGTAADLRRIWSNRAEQCRNLDRVRNAVMGGVGGVATYSGGDAHIDARNYRAQWNVCAGVLSANNRQYRSPTVQDYRQQRAAAAPRQPVSRPQTRQPASATTRCSAVSSSMSCPAGQQRVCVRYSHVPWCQNWVSQGNCPGCYSRR
jgi:hypothetical protein